MFSSIFGKKKSSSSGFIQAAKYNKPRGGFTGGYGAWTFRNIIEAHSSAEDIVEEFGLDQEGAAYGDCWDRALREVKQEAVEESLLMSILNFFTGDDLEFDYGEVEKRAYDYAIELADSWINGEVWIPRDVLDWAYYVLSSHNG